MSFEVRACRNDRVMLFSYAEPITAMDIESAFEKFRVVADKATAPVHSVSDLSLVSLLPANMLGFVRSPQSPICHPNAGQMVVVSRNNFVGAVMSAIARLMPQARIHPVPSMEQAWIKIDDILAQEAQR